MDSQPPADLGRSSAGLSADRLLLFAATQTFLFQLRIGVDVAAAGACTGETLREKIVGLQQFCCELTVSRDCSTAVNQLYEGNSTAAGLACQQGFTKRARKARSLI